MEIIQLLQSLYPSTGAGMPMLDQLSDCGWENNTAADLEYRSRIANLLWHNNYFSYLESDSQIGYTNDGFTNDGDFEHLLEMAMHKVNLTT
jgi:hypothetical protein